MLHNILECIEDWRAHLINSYLFYNQGDLQIPFLVTDVHLSNEDADIENLSIEELILRGHIIRKGGDGRYGGARSVAMNPIHTKGLRLGFPEIGMADAGDIVCYVGYNNARQWKKSLTHTLLEIYCPVSYEMREVGIYLDEIDLLNELLYKSINKEYTSVDDALWAVSQGHVLGRAIGQHFSIVAKEGVPTPVLVYKKVAIGKCTDNGDIQIAQELSYIHESLLEQTTLSNDRIKYE